MGGSGELIIQDFRLVESAAAQLGLKLNQLAKLEVMFKDSITLHEFLSAAPGFNVTAPEHTMFLGSPLSNFIDNCVATKVGV